MEAKDLDINTENQLSGFRIVVSAGQGCQPHESPKSRGLRLLIRRDYGRFCLARPNQSARDPSMTKASVDGGR